MTAPLVPIPPHIRDVATAARLAPVTEHCSRCGDCYTITVGRSHLDEHEEPCPACLPDDDRAGVPCTECDERGDDGSGHVLLDGKYMHVSCAAYALIYEREESDRDDHHARVVAEIVRAMGGAR